MILYKELPEESKYRFEMYLHNYRELVKYLNAKEKDDQGFVITDTVVTGTHAGKLEDIDQAWIEPVAMRFRKLMDPQGGSAGYGPIKNLLFSLPSEESDKSKIHKLIADMKRVEKKYWNRIVLPMDYRDIPITAEKVVDITHNQYLFHDGTSKAPRTNERQGDTDNFRKGYLTTNPLIVNYIGIIIGRRLALGMLALFIQELMDNNLLQLELVDFEDIKPDEFLDLKITLFGL